MTRRRSGRAAGFSGASGFTVIEVVVAAMLAAGLLIALGTTAAAVRGVLDELARDAEEVETVRIARALFDHLSIHDAMIGGGPGPDELTVDFPVGHAEPCDTLWAWAGLRWPVAGRDSAVVMDSLARLHRVGLSGARRGDCGGSAALRLSTTPSVPGGRRIVVFEPGVVRIDDAVRYARARTPRQPLTAAVLESTRSTLEWDTAGVGAAAWVTLERDSIRLWRRSWRIQ